MSLDDPDLLLDLPDPRAIPVLSEAGVGIIIGVSSYSSSYISRSGSNSFSDGSSIF